MRRIFSIVALTSLLAFSLACGGGNGTVWPPPGDGGDGRPAGYDLLYQEKICRWHDDAFPLLVYIYPPPPEAGGFGAELLAAAVGALDTWDNVLNSIPDPFSRVDSLDSADIFVRWEGMKVDGYTLAVEYDDHIAIHKIAMSDDLRNPISVELILGHELGHALGLGHSHINGDLMFSPVSPGVTSLTLRDSDMFAWLYEQMSFIPILTY